MKKIVYSFILLGIVGFVFYGIIVCVSDINATKAETDVQLKDKNNEEYIYKEQLSIKENVYKLYEKYQGKIDLLINNAGFGACGPFKDTDVERELEMVDVNVKAMHLLMKLMMCLRKLSQQETRQGLT